MEVFVKCKVSYLPFEARIDKVTFELLVAKTRPKDLIIINASSNKVDHIRNFC